MWPGGCTAGFIPMAGLYKACDRMQFPIVDGNVARRWQEVVFLVSI